MNLPSFVKRQTVTQAAVLIAIVLFLSKLIGFAREILVAKYFGATGITDAFLVALIIPGLILGLFASGLNTLIIPVYIEKRAADLAAARRFVNSVFIVSVLFFLAISVVVFIFAPAFVKIIAFGFKGERFASAVTLTRWLIFSGIFTVLTGLLTGLLQSEKQFLAPALIALTGNAVLVLSLFLLTRRLGINSWTAGQIALALLNFSLLYLLLFKKYGFFRSLDWHSINWKEISRFGYLLVPLVVSSGVSFVNQIIDKTIGSTLDVGSIAAINFATRVWGIPISLLVVPIVTGVFPAFSELAVAGTDRAELSSKISRTLSMSWFFVVPSSFFLFFLAAPIVRLLFERGAFDPAATSLTSAVVQMYAFGLFAHAASPVLGQAFYSFKNTVTPLVIGVITVALNIVLNIILARLMGAPGIALATSIVMAVNFLLFSLFLKRYVPVLSKPLGFESLKIVLSSVPIGIICLISRPLFAGSSASTLSGFASLLLRLGLVGIAGLAAFLLTCALLKVSSLAFARDYLLPAIGRFLKKREA